jgi:RNA polymerase-binding transcription factor DksA
MPDDTNPDTSHRDTSTGGASTTAGTYWTGERLEAARRRLSARSSALRADIQRELRKYDHDRYGVVADRVGDAGDDSVADLLVHVDLSEIQRDVAELRAIDAAFKRIAAGTYGYCTDCGEPIPTARLEQLPEAARDVACQQRFEARYRRDPTPTL